MEGDRSLGAFGLLHKAGDILDKSPGLLVTAGALLYGCGIVVCNLSLYRYGAYSLDLLRTRYVMTGCLLTFLFVLYLFCGVLALRAARAGWKTWGKGSQWEGFMLGVSGLVFGLVPPYSITCFVSDGKLPAFQWESTRACLLLWLTAVVVPTLTLALKRELEGLFFAPDGLLAMIQLQYRLHLLGLVIPTFACLFGYSWFVYPYMPPTIGGGAPSRVEVFASEQGQQALVSSLGLKSASASPIGPLALIDETPADYLFAEWNQDYGASRQVAVRLRKDLILAVVSGRD
jgi:hypothetical protein